MVTRRSGRRAASDADESAAAWLAADRHADLLPTPWFSDTALEDFVEAILKHDVLLGEGARHVAHVERWGVPGDKQDGIDFFGRFSDGIVAAWQVKQLKNLTAGLVRKAVKAVTFQGAEELYLIYGGIAKEQARAEMRNHAGWTLWDRRDLTDRVRMLPGYARRELIEQHWDEAVRRTLMGSAADTFISLDAFRVSRRNYGVLNDAGGFVGRDSELCELSAALDRDTDQFRQIVLVSGPGGRGKSRLVSEALGAQQDRRPTVPITCLGPRRILTPSALGELRLWPCIVFIDDAHHDPSALGALLADLHQNPDRQVVIATRTSALRAVEHQVSANGFTSNQYLSLRLGNLGLDDARHLVTSLVSDLTISFPLRNYLAGQATHSPHVAVILSNLIRKGQINGAIAVNDDLRKSVLAHYGENLLPAELEGIGTATAYRMIATYACLQPVDDTDEALKSRIADFCGLTVDDLVRLHRLLVDHGIIISSQGRVGVIPDVLADQIVENAAADGAYDRGFARDLWEMFGSDNYHRLALSLGDLDWRLTHRDGPNVMAPVWDSLRHRIRTGSYWDVHHDLHVLEPFVHTQPAQLVSALDELSQRLAHEDGTQTLSLADADDTIHQRRWPGGLGGSSNDLRSRMPALYAGAARSLPDLLERVLDSIWDLQKAEPQRDISRLSDANNIIATALGNLARLPDRSFPARIVAHVAARLHYPEPDAITVLSALTALLAKEATSSTRTSSNSLSLQSHLIRADTMRPVRDQIRVLLLALGTSSDLRLVGAAVALLDNALCEPRGPVGYDEARVAVLAWEDDDLATISTLSEIASHTSSVVVRRHIRDVISFPAQHAKSVQVQHAALTLAASLDAESTLEACLSDLMLWRILDLCAEPVTHVPALDELVANRESSSFAAQSATNDESRAEYFDQAVSERHRRVAIGLGQLDNPDTAHHILDRLLRDATQLRPNSYFEHGRLIGQIKDRSPALLEPLIRKTVSAEPGPLDAILSCMVANWIEVDPDAATRWVREELADGRDEVRRALAHGFSTFDWDYHKDVVRGIWEFGSADSDPSVAQGFLGGGGVYLRDDPAATATLLIQRGISARSATRALQGASRFNGNGYGRNLDDSAARAILPLIAHADPEDYRVQEILSGIAATHPRLVLDHLDEHRHHAWYLGVQVHGLAGSFDTHAQALVSWIVERLDRDPYDLGQTLRVAVQGQLTENQANAVAERCPHLSGPELRTVADLLRRLEMWPAEHPYLADRLLSRARETSGEHQVLDYIRDGLDAGTYESVNGVSEGLNSARDAVVRATDVTTDAVLRAEYETARARLERAIAKLADAYHHDDGW